jgi:hypothetical protein
MQPAAVMVPELQSHPYAHIFPPCPKRSYQIRAITT